MGKTIASSNILLRPGLGGKLSFRPFQVGKIFDSTNARMFMFFVNYKFSHACKIYLFKIQKFNGIKSYLKLSKICLSVINIIKIKTVYKFGFKSRSNKTLTKHKINEKSQN